MLPPPEQKASPPDYARIAAQLDRIAAMMRMAGRTAAAKRISERAASLRADLPRQTRNAEFLFRI
jgi:hypothetical protein